MKTISQLLKEIKDSSSLSEQAIAEKLGVSQPTVNRILGGQDSCLHGTYLRIADLHKEVVDVS